jgi:glycosyltransferase involved in cell wall biosynthesis
VVLKAFALILKEIPDASLEIVGDGPALPSLKIEAKRMDLDDRVKFTGFVPHDTLPAVFARNDLFLTASTMETQGLVVLESLATGMPSVGVDAFALPELIEDGKNGFIVPPYDHIAMAQHALKVLKDSALYNSFSKKAVETATEHSLEKCADKMEQTYSQVISKKEIPQPGEELPEIEDFED